MNGDQWWERAACKGQPLELFFPGVGQGCSHAKKFCKVCPVTTECLNEALKIEDTRSRHGVWGGLSKYEREVMFDGKAPNPVHIRTECIAGHPLTPENSINHGRGRRRCRTCDEERKAMRTKCVNGHPWTDENTAIRKDGYKICRICDRERGRNRATTNNNHQRQQTGTGDQQVVREDRTTVPHLRPA